MVLNSSQHPTPSSSVSSLYNERRTSNLDSPLELDRLYTGDCLKLFPQIEDGTIDLETISEQFAARSRRWKYRTTSFRISAPGETHGWDGATYRISPLTRFGRLATNSGAGSNQSSGRMLRPGPSPMVGALESIGERRSMGSSSASAPAASGTSFPSTSATTARSIAGSSDGVVTASSNRFGPF